MDLYFIQVMIQPHNRHMSFSLYIAALAVSDTAALLSGESHVDVQSYNFFKSFLKHYK